jgi:hypothetical protein
MQLFEVAIPQGAHTGSRFALVAGGTQVGMTCPVNKGPGERLCFTLPRTRERESRRLRLRLLDLNMTKKCGRGRSYVCNEERAPRQARSGRGHGPDWRSYEFEVP